MSIILKDVMYAYFLLCKYVYTVETERCFIDYIIMIDVCLYEFIFIYSVLKVRFIEQLTQNFR